MFRSFGLCAVLLMVLECISPGLPSPLWPICDLRALDHFIKKAQEAEVAMRSCKEECSLAEPLTVPQPSVDFDAWRKKTSEQQAQEVQSGLFLLSQAMRSLRSSVSSNAALHAHIDNNLGNIISIGQVLRSLSLPEYSPSDGGTTSTQRVTSASALFQVHFNFLRGKVRLLISHAPACQQAIS
ncbi:erythropoietin [Engraulis encrasicolus]|uniref:erythropoietin n=1 Tax=Engraulis encrasicolus TaxID=184585 RepID=UPI002FD70FC8